MCAHTRVLAWMVLFQLILDTLEWLRYNRDEDEATYIKLLEELKDIAAPVMSHMSKALAQRAEGGPRPIILARDGEMGRDRDRGLTALRL